MISLLYNRRIATAFFFIPLLSLTKLSHAQNSIGLEAGMSSSYLVTNISNRTSTVINSGRGFTANILLRHTIYRCLSAELIPGITRKSYSINRTDSLAGVYESFNNTYLQLPIGISLTYGRTLQVTMASGIYLGYWMAGRIKGKTPDIYAVTDSISPSGQVLGSYQLKSYDEKYAFSKQRDNRLETGWMLEAGIQYPFSHQYRVSAKARYYQALTSQEKNLSINQVQQYNQTWTFTIGISRMLDKK
jgi:hypothetical protein